MPTNQWNAALYDRKHSFVFEYGKDVLALLAPQPGERILDVGCGTGHLTKSIADAGATVVGIDSSADMIEKAQGAYPDVEFHVADARDFSFDEPFDAVFSNAALHWILEPERAVISMSNALKPGGRFVIEMGGKNNVGRILTALEAAMRELAGREVSARNFFPSIGEYAPLLEKHGLEVEQAWLFDRPTRLDDGEKGVRNWLAMFRGSVFEGISEEMKEAVLSHVETTLRPELFHDGKWTADYRRLRITARKKGMKDEG
jgi:trans-aconitate methyltransferase